MSESDSFISEVTEEVRRESFYRMLRRWGWLIAALVLLIVGAAVWREWSLARDLAAARAAGDAMRAALEEADPAARAEALAALPAGPATPVVRMAAAGARIAAGDRDAAAALLDQVASDPAAPALYRSLAALQRVTLLGSDMAASDRLATIEGLAADNAPFRLLALEQRALLRLETDEREAALADLREILGAPSAPEGLRNRVQQLLIASGGAPAPSAPPEG